jgi:hypothetical protein
MVARPAGDDQVLACVAALESRLAGPPPEADALAAFPPATLEAALETLARRRGEPALALVARLAEGGGSKAQRRAARRALYRLSMAGIEPPRRPSRPVVERPAPRALRAWTSGVDGTGSRALWILFEGSFGGLALCSVIVNDQAGLLSAAGGSISRRRLERELEALRRDQKLPWVEIAPEAARGLVARALALHAGLGTEPPADFARWRPFFADAPPAPPPQAGPAEGDDPSPLDRSGDLFELPELASWFLHPGGLEADALELLQARESRLVLSAQQKTEREAAILDRVLERALAAEARGLWAARLLEMALLWEATGRAREARLARATARALADPRRAARHIPFARLLGERGLTAASEVALGRLPAAQVSRLPRA